MRAHLALLAAFLGAVALAQISVLPPKQPQARPYRAVTYNILVGFNDYEVGNPYMKGADRLKAAQKWLRGTKPDLVALQELNGYTPQRLADEAKAWGHTNVVLLKESGYDIGLTARSPITVVERVVAGMHHGLLHARVDGLDVLVTHFYPGGDYARKMREADMVLERVAKIREEGRECLVIGDLNACTRQDEPLFGDVARDWHTKWQWPLVDGYPHYGTIDRFLESGFVDVWAKLRPRTQPMFPGRPRVDYILASPGLARRCVRAEWVDTDFMHTISDHAPLVVDFALAGR